MNNYQDRECFVCDEKAQFRYCPQCWPPFGSGNYICDSCGHYQMPGERGFFHLKNCNDLPGVFDEVKAALQSRNDKSFVALTVDWPEAKLDKSELDDWKNTPPAKLAQTFIKPPKLCSD